MKDSRHAVFHAAGVQWLPAVLLTSAGLQRRASSAHALLRVLGTLKRLSSDAYSEFLVAYLEQGLALCGEEWGYCDLLSILLAASEVLRPETYLEIGVRRGRSLGVVAESAPQADLYGFDLWVADYAGMPNPGPQFVRDEIKRLGHRGSVELVSGDSRVTLPAFLSANPELTFDLITIDGDHSDEGARTDLRNVLPRLRTGGVVVMDDMAHPQHPYLKTCWDDCVQADPAFDSRMYTDLGFGVAFAVRKSDLG